MLALGGNALACEGEEPTVVNQFRRARESMAMVVELARAGWQIVLVHGNGPQVGDELARNEAARRLGHRVGRVPVVGAVAQWDAHERSPMYTGGPRLRGAMRAGAYGHVAWVQHVHTDGSATVAHYNGSGTRAFSTSRVKAPRYLYVGVPAPR